MNPDENTTEQGASALAREAHRVRERIAQAPVDGWLKREAMADLDSLLLAAGEDLGDFIMRHAPAEAPVENEDAPGETDQNPFSYIGAPVEGAINPAYIDFEERELRRTALGLAIQRVGTVPGYDVVAMAEGYAHYIRTGEVVPR